MNRIQVIQWSGLRSGRTFKEVQITEINPILAGAG